MHNLVTVDCDSFKRSILCYTRSSSSKRNRHGRYLICGHNSQSFTSRIVKVWTTFRAVLFEQELDLELELGLELELVSWL